MEIILTARNSGLINAFMFEKSCSDEDSCSDCSDCGCNDCFCNYGDCNDTRTCEFCGRDD